MSIYVTEKELGIAKETNNVKGKGKAKSAPDNGYVELIIDDDGTGSPWEGGINGTFYRISRNKPVRVPANLAKLIKSNASVTILSERELSEYKSTSGKRLGTSVR